MEILWFTMLLIMVSPAHNSNTIHILEIDLLSNGYANVLLITIVCEVRVCLGTKIKFNWAPDTEKSSFALRGGALTVLKTSNQKSREI